MHSVRQFRQQVKRRNQISAAVSVVDCKHDSGKKHRGSGNRRPSRARVISRPREALSLPKLLYGRTCRCGPPRLTLLRQAIHLGKIKLLPEEPMQ